MQLCYYYDVITNFAKLVLLHWFIIIKVLYSSGLLSNTVNEWQRVGCLDFWISDQLKLISLIFRDRLLKYSVRWSLSRAVFFSTSLCELDFTLASVHLWNVSFCFLQCCPSLSWKRCQRLNSLGICHCCTVTALVSSSSDAESFRSIHKHKENKTKPAGVWPWGKCLSLAVPGGV